MAEDNPEQREALVGQALKSHFRPEFLNRVDETIIFDRLTEDDIKAIVSIQVKRVQERLEQQGLTLEVSDEALSLIATEGYDPVYGARPLKRVIQKQVLDPLSLELREGKFGEGDTVNVTAEGESLRFRKEAVSVAQV